ncbi:MAG: hypothetical protein HC858_11875, partial [Brachymonas sp.]|nr:hypothetical protein [Brachymonas sp.]
MGGGERNVVEGIMVNEGAGQMYYTDFSSFADVAVTTVGAGVTFSFLTACNTANAADVAPFEPTQWYSMDGAGIVTVNIIRAEMGQHVGTSLARILADELEGRRGQ